MEVKRTTTINGFEVTLLKEFCGISFYIQGNGEGDDLNIFYFVKGDEVIQKMEIDCSEGQGVGYISDISFSDIDSSD